MTEFGDQGTLKTPFSVFCLQRFYTLAHKWALDSHFLRLHISRLFFTLSVNVKYANNRLHEFRSVVSRRGKKRKFLATFAF